MQLSNALPSHRNHALVTVLSLLASLSVAGCSGDSPPELASLGIAVQGLSGADTEIHVEPGTYSVFVSGASLPTSAEYDLQLVNDNADIVANLQLLGSLDELPGGVDTGDEAFGSVEGIMLAAGVHLTVGVTMNWNDKGQIDNAFDFGLDHVGAPELNTFYLTPAPYAKVGTPLATGIGFSPAANYDGMYAATLRIGQDITHDLACDGSQCAGAKLASPVAPGHYEVEVTVETISASDGDVAKGSATKWMCFTAAEPTSAEDAVAECDAAGFFALTAPCDPNIPVLQPTSCNCAQDPNCSQTFEQDCKAAMCKFESQMTGSGHCNLTCSQ